MSGRGMSWGVVADGGDDGDDGGGGGGDGVVLKLTDRHNAECGRKAARRTPLILKGITEHIGKNGSAQSSGNRTNS